MEVINAVDALSPVEINPQFSELPPIIVVLIPPTSLSPVKSIVFVIKYV